MEILGTILVVLPLFIILAPLAAKFGRWASNKPPYCGDDELLK